jgi:hypothetical protein
MERVRLCTWTQVTDPNFNPPTTTGYFDSKNQRTPCTVTFTAVEPPAGSVPDEYRDQMLLVTVELTWTSGNNQQHKRSMQSLVARYGMNSYVSTGG